MSTSRQRDEEINTLAALVARIATRCWTCLGTEEVSDVVRLADLVGTAARKRLLAGKRRPKVET